MTEADIQEEVFSKHTVVDTTVSWVTPAGRPRTAPIYEAIAVNEYLGKRRIIKDRCLDELQKKVTACMTTWANTEVKKRLVEGKKDAKQKGKAEAERLDAEAREQLFSLRGILKDTLSVDDKIDWGTARDTRKFHRFSFTSPPKLPLINPPFPFPKPGLTWLLRGRYKRWLTQCENAVRENQKFWEADVQKYEVAKEAARSKHSSEKQSYLKEQERFNNALLEFRKRFEAGEALAIEEYCFRVFEQSQYPDCLPIVHSTNYDEESKIVIVELEVPSSAVIPQNGGYKFVSSTNEAKPVPLKKRESSELYGSILDQLVVRTAHEVFESCYISSVTGVIVSAFVADIDKATGLDKRKRVRSISADRKTFEAFDLARIEPSACVAKLSEGVGHIEV